MTEISLLEQVKYQKRFLKYPSSSEYCAAIQNRDYAYLWGSEFSRVDWERELFLSISTSAAERVFSESYIHLEELSGPLFQSSHECFVSQTEIFLVPSVTPLTISLSFQQVLFD